MVLTLRAVASVINLHIVWGIWGGREGGKTPSQEQSWPGRAHRRNHLRMFAKYILVGAVVWGYRKAITQLSREIGVEFLHDSMDSSEVPACT